jgi:lysyl-tRNA synthetase class 2
MPSTVIRAFDYDPAERRLDVNFVSGRRYSYFEVPPETYEAMKRSFAKGEFFNAHIRGHFRYARRVAAPQPLSEI